MNPKKNLRTRVTVLLLVLLSFGLSFCKKSNSNNGTREGGDNAGSANVTVNMLGVAANSEPLTTSGSKPATQAVASAGVQTTVVPFAKNISIVATLAPKGVYAGETKGVLSTTAISPVKQTTAAVQTPLGANVKYEVMVYDSNGNWIATKNYTNGQEASVAPFVLDAGKTYTFVAFSRNTATIPATTNTSLLSTAAASQLGDPMYFTKTVTLTAGENDLDIVLKHEVNLVTVNLILNTSIGGNITAIGIGELGPTYVSTDMALIDGSLTYGYGGGLGTDHAVNFGTIPVGGVRSLSSSPISIIFPASTDGFFKIPSITIGGITKSNLAFNGLTITPGVEYNLNITFQ